MNFIDYIHTFPRQERSSVRQHIAKTLGVSEVYVRMMSSGTKSIPGKYALTIEKITDGQVSRHEISPSLYPVE